jgi:hypothetical protein
MWLELPFRIQGPIIFGQNSRPLSMLRRRRYRDFVVLDHRLYLNTSELCVVIRLNGT